MAQLTALVERIEYANGKLAGKPPAAPRKKSGASSSSSSRRVSKTKTEEAAETERREERGHRMTKSVDRYGELCNTMDVVKQGSDDEGDQSMAEADRTFLCEPSRRLTRSHSGSKSKLPSPMPTSQLTPESKAVGRHAAPIATPESLTKKRRKTNAHELPGSPVVSTVIEVAAGLNTTFVKSPANHDEITKDEDKENMIHAATAALQKEPPKSCFKTGPSKARRLTFDIDEDVKDSNPGIDDQGISTMTPSSGSSLGSID
mgnify:CR=1 FL=1